MKGVGRFGGTAPYTSSTPEGIEWLVCGLWVDCRAVPDAMKKKQISDLSGLEPLFPSAIHILSRVWNFGCDS
jgi:hypothetical protein